MTLIEPRTLKGFRDYLPEAMIPRERLIATAQSVYRSFGYSPIDTPTERQDFDYIRWYLLHEASSVFVDEGTWYLIVHSRCRHLQSDNRCGIYETRPQICRDYTTKDCEYDDDWVYEQYFETPEQVEEYMEVVLPRKRGENIRSPRPGLPVLRTVRSPK